MVVILVTAKPLRGIGADLDLIRRIVGGDDELQSLLTQATERGSGRPAETVNNVNGFKDRRPTGNSKAQALRRLRKHRPDLHQKVIEGELSPHTAAIRAGFRKRTISYVIGVAQAIVLAST